MGNASSPLEAAPCADNAPLWHVTSPIHAADLAVAAEHYARLFATSPRLLAALTEALFEIEHGPSAQGARIAREAREAILAAGGRP